MKTLRTIIVSIMICITLFGSVAAVNVEPANSKDVEESASVQPRAEETCWYYREIDGVKQMRLWSLTYGRWLTDWITLE